MTTPPTFLILLVDDDERTAQLVDLAARKTFPEARLHAVRSYAQAISFLEERTGMAPRLILLDIDLQVGPSGLDFLERLRQHPQWYPIPTVILTHIDDQHAMSDSYRAGANHFSVKPFAFEEWKAYMRQLKEYWFELAGTPRIWLEGKYRQPN